MQLGLYCLSFCEAHNLPGLSWTALFSVVLCFVLYSNSRLLLYRQAAEENKQAWDVSDDEAVDHRQEL
jgi:hypothetical protein